MKSKPLDFSVNKVTKESLRNKYSEYWIGEYNIKVSKSAIVEWIDELWHSYSVKTN